MTDIGFDDHGPRLEALPTIEEHDSGASEPTFNPSGDFTPSSSSSLVSGGVRRLICHFQQKITELELKITQLDGGQSDLKTQKEALNYRNGVLEQSNKALHRQVRDLEQLIGFLWAAFEDRTEPHSQMGMQIRKTVREAVPSVFNSLDITCLDGESQTFMEQPALIQQPQYYGPDGEPRQASASQREPSPMDMLSDLAEFLASNIGGPATESDSFDDLFLDPSLRD